MIKFDMWYGNKVEEVEKIDINFYSSDGEYKGNMYVNNKCIDDYTCNDSVELENSFPQLTFTW